MKKLVFSLVLILAFIFSQSCLAYGFDGTDVPLTIALNYLKWASECFGVEDLRNEFDGYLDGDDDYTIVDDLKIVDSKKHEIIQYIKLDYFNVGKDEAQQALRAMSMFAAIEYGALGEWTDTNTLMAVMDGYDFISALNDALTEYIEELADGKVIPFYVSKRFTYCVTANIKEGIVITVA